ncbi:MAG: FAD-dependent oxidoreductase [Mycobacteriaceae bacterium]|nr:FAD-dependent oxidoreductase [Mycobacteriaceae bacterium]
MTSPRVVPVIVSVDDDAGVSRALARDLRRHYGQDYRIVRAESGAAALEVLRELKLRGQQVAVLIVDYRMPEMDGIAFLEQGMQLYPYARRILLTAYADTSAAIDAINVVDLDYYLLKPWDPPEEKLYPVVDAQLESWRAEHRRPSPETKVVGTRWDPRSAQIRDFLARNQQAYRWHLCDEAEGARLLAAAELTSQDCPVVITTSGETLVRPTEAELADKIGIHTTPRSDMYDLVIIGGGPGGLGAAVYGASEGLRTVLVERIAVGGQAGQSSRIENYLGFPDGVSGSQLTVRARMQALKFGAELLTTRVACGLEVRGSARTVQFTDGTSVDAKSVIVATGVRYRHLDAPGVAEFTGRGVFYGSTLSEMPGCKEQDVFVVGGANSAGQAAVFLAGTARSVTMLVRADSLVKSMSQYLIEQIEQIDNITVRTGTEVVSAHGDAHLDSLVLRDSESGIEEKAETQWMFLFIGAEPDTDWLDGVVARDRQGYVPAGPDLMDEGRPPAGWEPERPPYYLESTVPGVFAVGDVRAGSAKRVASAVGEGAMAVMLVHRYLADS